MIGSRRDFLKNAGLVVMAGAGFLTADQWLRGADLGRSASESSRDGGDRHARL